MSSTFANARGLAGVLLLGSALGGCGERRLDLALSLAADSCTQTVPSNGSLLFQMSANRGAIADGGSSAFCGGCLAVALPITGADAITSFLRANAPVCAGVHPNTSLTVRVTAWSTPGCPEGPTSRILCAQSVAVPLPDGNQDAVVSVVLTCNAACTGVCTPTTCAALGKNCGSISDGCGGTLYCGACMPPLRCGVAGVPNVCAK